ncbi:hypothetical protein O9929_13510 [Vibrio lentus]|nr:hypothetical protein [Vibrio lentus]
MIWKQEFIVAKSTRKSYKTSATCNEEKPTVVVAMAKVMKTKQSALKASDATG